MKNVLGIVLLMLVSFCFGAITQRSLMSKDAEPGVVSSCKDTIQDKTIALSNGISPPQTINSEAERSHEPKAAEGIVPETQKTNIEVERDDEPMNGVIAENFARDVLAKSTAHPEYSFIDEVETSFENDSEYMEGREEREQYIYDTFYSDPILFEHPINNLACKKSQCRIDVLVASESSADELSMALVQSFQREGKPVQITQKRNTETGEVSIYLANPE